MRHPARNGVLFLYGLPQTAVLTQWSGRGTQGGFRSEKKKHFALWADAASGVVIVNLKTESICAS